MLGHLRVLDLTDRGAMIGGAILGDLGADVVLVEPPGGADLRRAGPFWHDEQHPERSLSFWSFNRNKRSVTLDLETAEGREALLRMAGESDIVLESFAPGRMAALGLGYEALAAANPRLVMVSISPFGQDGPKAGWAASDITIWAASKVANMTGDDDRAPLSLAVPQAFLHAGAEAAVGALIAHHGAVRSGRGQHVDVSAQAATAMATQGTILDHAWGASETLRMAGGVKFGGVPLRFVNPAKDGYVSVTFLFGTAMGPFARRLMETLHDEGFVDPATRDKDWLGYTGLILSGQEPLSEYLRCCDSIAAFTGSHTKDELFRLGMEKGLLIVPVSTMADVAESPQLAARDYWVDVEQGEAGMVRHGGAFAKFGATPLAKQRRAPSTGEHTAEVLAASRPPMAQPQPEQDETALPLAGLKVLDLMWVIAGPWGTRYVADYGATVVKVESTTRVDTLRTIGPFKDMQPGPERSGGWATVNAGKIGLTLNLACPESHEVMRRLVAWADVVTDSFTPGAMARAGFGYEELRKLNPGIIMISSCLNGQTGPSAKLAGYGTMGSQLAGFGTLAGWPDRAPAGAAGAYTDYITPKFVAVSILAALEHRRRTGEGQYIDLSQAECAMNFLAPALLDYRANGRATHQRGNDSLEFFPHGAYRAEGDDRWLALAVETPAHWAALCQVLGRADWASDSGLQTAEGRRGPSGEIDDAIAAWVAGRPVEEAEAAMQEAGVPAHRVANSEDAVADPQLVHRAHFVTVDHPEFGPVVVENSRMRFSRTGAAVARPGPTFGQDSAEVLTAILGYEEDELADLYAAGALE